MKPSNDREAITLILDGLREKGIKPLRVHDGEDVVPTDTTEKAVEAIMAVDEASIALQYSDGSETWIFFVLGNDPEEVACDYGVSLSEHIDPIVDAWL